VRQNRIARAVAPAGAARAAVAAALAIMLLAGCGARLRSSNGGIGPYPENYEALVRNFVTNGPYRLRSYRIASVSAPVPGAVVDERTALVRILPDATVSIGWVVRTSGTTEFRLAEGYPTLFAWERAYCLLLRDGAVRAFVRECSENWPERVVHVQPLDVVVARGLIRPLP
jgi:hypothetical protein